MPSRRRSVWNESPERAPVSRDRFVEGFERAGWSMAEKTTHRARQAHRLEEVGNPGSVAGQRAVGPHHSPSVQPLVLGQGGEQRTCRGVLQREKGELLAAIEPCDAAGGEPAEAALTVVEEHRPRERLYEVAPPSNPSRVARTSRPIVSRT